MSRRSRTCRVGVRAAPPPPPPDEAIRRNPQGHVAAVDRYVYTFAPEMDAPALCLIEGGRIVYNFTLWPKYLREYGFLPYYSSSLDDRDDVDELGRFIEFIDLHEFTHLAEPNVCHTRDAEGAREDSWTKFLLPLAKEE